MVLQIMGLGEGLTTHQLVTKRYTGLQNLLLASQEGLCYVESVSQSV